MTTSNTKRYAWPAVELGQPQTSGPLTVFPVVGSNGHGGGYMLLADAVAKGIASVKELNTSGDVPIIQIKNKGKLPLLGIQGEEYVGAKQNRTLNISVLVGKGKTKIPVTCVEQGRWDSGPVHFSPGAYETSKLRSLKAMMILNSRKSSTDTLGKFSADQNAVWDEVTAESQRHRVESPTSALHDVYESGDVKGLLDEMASGIELPVGSRGAVAAIGGRLVAADVFESRDVFDRIWPRLLQSYTLSALDMKKGVPPSLEVAEAFVSKPRSLTWSATPSVGLGEDVRWEDKHCVATGLAWEDRYLHVSVFAREE
jgi:hypothetical protein